MSFLELCSQRKSCRKYNPKPVPRDIIEKCIEAARLAPSACNSQPWKFIVVDTHEIKNKLADAAFSGIYSMNKFAKEAPVLVVIIRENSKVAAHLAGILKGIQYNQIDIGISGEHFVLQAAEQNLGTCWLGWFDVNGVKKNLGLPTSTKIGAIISLGYPLEQSLNAVYRKSKESICEFR